MSDDAIGDFVEAVESFFLSGGNGDEVPHSDGDIIRICQTEDRRAIGSEEKKKARLLYAYALVLSPKSDQVQDGIDLLEESVEDCDEPHKSLLLLAYGYFRLGKYQESTDYFNRCIEYKNHGMMVAYLSKIREVACIGFDDFVETKGKSPWLIMPLDSTRRKDLLMSHLLRVACFYQEPSSSQQSLSNSLPKITMDLHRNGLVSEGVLTLSSHPIRDFNKAFDYVFQDYMIETPFPDFWKLASLRTRYLQNFKQLRKLGKGGFGSVFLCKNKHDGREYALKLITSKINTDTLNQAMLREVEALSGLQHQHVVRYYQAWIEQGVHRSGETPPESEAEDSVTDSRDSDIQTQEEFMCLYIQMEYCPRTLRHLLDKEGYVVDEDFAWKTIRQILDGLGYIHDQNIIHRDLNPSNIFFNSRGDVKIGDFGLAKFLDKDEAGIIRTTSKSTAKSQKLGTQLYLAPEILKGAEEIDQKVDIYSLGILFLEIWYPFGSKMQRAIVLGNVREGKWPAAWELEYPNLAAQLKRMLSENPNERPTVSELRTGLGLEA